MFLFWYFIPRKFVIPIPLAAEKKTHSDERSSMHRPRVWPPDGHTTSRRYRNRQPSTADHCRSTSAGQERVAQTASSDTHSRRRMLDQLPYICKIKHIRAIPRKFTLFIQS